MVTVNVEIPGTHGFMAQNGSGEEIRLAGELCEFLLARAGYTNPGPWTLRIEKTNHCSSESKIIRVIKWTPCGVSIRLKPKQFNTVDHLYLLIRPDNSIYRYEDIYNQLEGKAKSITGDWEKEYRQLRIKDKAEPKPVSQVNTALMPNDDPRPDFTHLSGALVDPDKLRYIFQRIYKLTKGQPFQSEKLWLKAFMEECEFDPEQHRARHVAILLSNCAAQGYLLRYEYPGYRLTLLGERVAKGDISALNEAIPLRRSTKPVPLPEVIQEEEEVTEAVPILSCELVVSLVDKAKQLLEVAARIQEIKAQKNQMETSIADLQQQVTLLCTEEATLLESLRVKDPEGKLINILSMLK